MSIARPGAVGSSPSQGLWSGEGWGASALTFSGCVTLNDSGLSVPLFPHLQWGKRAYLRER